MNPDITTQIYATSRVYRQTFLAVNLYNRLLGQNVYNLFITTQTYSPLHLITLEEQIEATKSF